MSTTSQSSNVILDIDKVNFLKEGFTSNLKSTLQSELIQGIVEITFTKLDGTERVMNCTLSDKIVPQSTEETTKTRKQNENILSVWDVEKNDWRSFRVENVVKIKYDL